MRFHVQVMAERFEHDVIQRMLAGGAQAKAGSSPAPARNPTRDRIKATRGRMNLAWRTVKATAEHFYPTGEHFYLVLRTVESDPRSDLSDARSLKSHLQDSESDRSSDLSDPATCNGVAIRASNGRAAAPARRMAWVLRAGDFHPLDPAAGRLSLRGPARCRSVRRFSGESAPPAARSLSCRCCP